MTPIGFPAPDTAKIEKRQVVSNLRTELTRACKLIARRFPKAPDDLSIAKDFLHLLPALRHTFCLCHHGTLTQIEQEFAEASKHIKPDDARKLWPHLVESVVQTEEVSPEQAKTACQTHFPALLALANSTPC